MQLAKEESRHQPRYWVPEQRKPRTVVPGLRIQTQSLRGISNDYSPLLRSQFLGEGVPPSVAVYPLVRAIDDPPGSLPTLNDLLDRRPPALLEMCKNKALWGFRPL